MVHLIISSLSHTQGVPSKISSLETAYPNWSWGNCQLGSDGTYTRIEYLTTYPTTLAGAYISRTYPQGLCSTENTNYLDFVQIPLEMLGMPLDICELSSPGVYQMYSTSSCGTTGQLLVGFYDDPSCLNELSVTPIWGQDCLNDPDLGLVDVVADSFCTEEATYLVETTEGKILGRDLYGARAWKGIRYGSAGRWEDAQRPPPFSGIEERFEFGASCLQPPEDDSPMSEDCLFLNVYAPPTESNDPGGNVEESLTLTF